MFLEQFSTSRSIFFPPDGMRKKAPKPTYKPRSVRRVAPPGDHPSRRTRCRMAPAAYPRFGRCEQHRIPPKGGHLCLALLPTGVARPPAFRRTPVVSYTAVSPSPDFSRARFLHSKKREGEQPGNALLCGPGPAGRPALGVTRRRALWSADFPRSHDRNRDRPVDLDTRITIT